MPTRVEGLLVERAEPEMLVYNPADNEAHALNATAAIVFDLCDGKATRADMVAALQRSGLPAESAVVDLALAELEDAGLLVDAGFADATGSDDDPAGPERVTRRTVMRRLGLSAAAVAMLPVVETILVQPAAAQTSGMPPPPPAPAPFFIPGLPPPPPIPA